MSAVTKKAYPVGPPKPYSASVKTCDEMLKIPNMTPELRDAWLDERLRAMHDEARFAVRSVAKRVPK